MKNLYNKLVNFLLKHIDKVLHFAFGMLIMLILSIFLPLWLSFLITVLVGAGKELFDQIVYKGFDWVDLGITTAGALITLICLILI